MGLLSLKSLMEDDLPYICNENSDQETFILLHKKLMINAIPALLTKMAPLIMLRVFP